MKAPIPPAVAAKAGTALIVEMLEREAGARVKAARQRYEATMKEHRRVFSAAERAARAVESEEIKEVERWLLNSLATVTGQPVKLTDIAAVQRETASGAKVSVARVRGIERAGGTR